MPAQVSSRHQSRRIAPEGPYVDEDVANVLRKVARVERMELGPFIEMLLRHWLAHERPQWKVIGSDEAPAGPRRTR